MSGKSRVRDGGRDICTAPPVGSVAICQRGREVALVGISACNTIAVLQGLRWHPIFRSSLH